MLNQRIAKKAPPRGDRWVTIREGHLKGRHILLDRKGYIVGGAIPKAFQGHHITQLKGIGTEENPFTDFSHEELKEIHQDFSNGHQEQKEEYQGMIDEIAHQLHMEHETKYGSPSSIANRIREIGGILPPRKGVDAYGSEYHESISPSIRSAIGNKTTGLPLDEVADELGLTASELVQALSETKHKGNLRPEHFYAEAERALDQIHGEETMKSRRHSIEMMRQEIAKIEAAMRRKEREGKKDKKLAAHYIDSFGEILLKTDNPLVHGKHESKEWQQAKQKVHTEYGLGPHDGSRYWRRVNAIYERMRTKVGGKKGDDVYRERMQIGKDGRLVVRKG